MGSLELDTTERLHFHFSLSCIGAGNGNPLQCSCLANPRDGGAWWASVHGVTQSQTRLKRCSSNSSQKENFWNNVVSFRRNLVAATTPPTAPEKGQCNPAMHTGCWISYKPCPGVNEIDKGPNLLGKGQRPA